MKVIFNEEEETEHVTMKPANPSMVFDNLYQYETWMLMKDRILVLAGEVDQDEMKTLCRRLMLLKQRGNEPVMIILNSVGGEVYAGLLAFDTIKDLIRSGIDVTIETRGIAASMGAILLQAGTKRIASPHSRIMIHEVSSWSWGKASELEEEAIETKKVNAMLAQIVAERSGKTIEEVLKLIKKKDYWMSASEALEFGLIDLIAGQ